MAAGTRIIKPAHRSVKAYYETLKGYAGQAVSHETAVRSAFQTLLADAAKLRHWMLVPELVSGVAWMRGASGATRGVGLLTGVSSRSEE